MLVSIVTPTFNSSRHILSCISSIFSQSHQAVEQIIVDNASTDATLALISSAESRVTEVISETDNGIYHAMNKGIQLAKGELIGVLNSDDYLSTSSVISKVVQAFSTNEVDIVFGNLDIVHPTSGKLLRHWRSSPYHAGGFARGWHPPHPSFFVRKSVYSRIGTFDIGLPVAADFEFMLRCLEVCGLPSRHLDTTLVTMRHGGESTRSLRNIITGHRSIAKAFQKHRIQQSRLYTMRRLFFKAKQLANPIRSFKLHH